MDDEASEILSTPDPNVMSDAFTVPVLLALNEELHLQYSACATVNILTSLIASHNAEVEGRGDQKLEKMVQISMAAHGQRRGLRTCVRSTVTAICRDFLTEQRRVAPSTGDHSSVAKVGPAPPPGATKSVGSPAVDLERASRLLDGEASECNRPYSQALEFRTEAVQSVECSAAGRVPLATLLASCQVAHGWQPILAEYQNSEPPSRDVRAFR